MKDITNPTMKQELLELADYYYGKTEMISEKERHEHNVL